METLSVRLARAVAAFLVLMLIIAVIGYGILELTGNWELVQLRTEVAHANAMTSLAEAEAARELATADRLRATGEQALAQAEGDAIRAPAEAAAWAVRVQTSILAWYAVVGPVGLLAAALAVAAGSGSVGVALGGCIVVAFLYLSTREPLSAGLE